MAKSISKSIRLSREVYGYIEKYRGDSFNEKFENIILDYQKKEKEIRARIISETKIFEKRMKDFEKAREKIRKLENMTWTVENCMGYLETIERQLKDVAVSQK